MAMRRVVSVVNTNNNVNWIGHPSAWAWYLGLILVAWLGISGLVDDSGLAWTYVSLLHGLVTFYLLHWSKGSPILEDQGKYDALTFWEQLDSGMYGTSTRKLFTVVPVLLFVAATHGTDFRKQPLALNLLVVVMLLVAKLPAMYKVRLLGINKY